MSGDDDMSEKCPGSLGPTTSSNSSSESDNASCITSPVLSSSLHTQIDRLAHQIQLNGGRGRITLTFVEGNICLVDQESNMVGDCCQIL